MNTQDFRSLQEAYMNIYEGKVAWDDPKNPNPSGYTPKEKSLAKRKQLGIDDPETRSFEIGGPGEEEYARHANLAAAQEKMKSTRNQPKGKSHKFKKNPFWKMDSGQVKRNIFGTDVYADKESSYPESVPKAKTRKSTLGGKFTQYEEQIELYDIILSYLLNEEYKKLPVGKMVSKALKHHTKGLRHAFKSGYVGSDTTEGQIESQKVNKKLKLASQIYDTLRSHNPENVQLKSKLLKKFGSQQRGQRPLPITKMKQKERRLMDSPEAEAKIHRALRSPEGSVERKNVTRDLERHGNIHDVRRSISTRGGKRRLPIPDVGRYKSEHYDTYDLILSHLLDEGYAETPEAAEVMMVNMSEEWRESIMEKKYEEDEKLPSGLTPKQKYRRKRKQFLKKSTDKFQGSYNPYMIHPEDAMETGRQRAQRMAANYGYGASR